MLSPRDSDCKITIFIVNDQIISHFLLLFLNLLLVFSHSNNESTHFFEMFMAEIFPSLSIVADMVYRGL